LAITVGHRRAFDQVCGSFCRLCSTSAPPQ
jgi:hypothetical protein